MDNAGYVGLSAQKALKKKLDVIANNVANMNTSGFKGQRAAFVEHVADVEKSDGSREGVSFAYTRATYMDTSQGGLTATSSPFDMALQGEGWFSYDTPEGVAYGRDGSFKIDGLGRLSTSEGHPVLDEGGGEIVITPEEASNLTVTADGTMSANGVALGRLGVWTFDNPQALERMGNGMFKAPDDAPPLPAMDASVVQGMVEGSNVNAIQEMTRLIDVHRTYDKVAKLAKNANDLEKDAIARLGKVY